MKKIIYAAIISLALSASSLSSAQDVIRYKIENMSKNAVQVETTLNGNSAFTLKHGEARVFQYQGGQKVTDIVKLPFGKTVCQNKDFSVSAREIRERQAKTVLYSILTDAAGKIFFCTHSVY